MATNVTFNINAVDKTKGVFDKVNKGVQNFDRNTKRAGGSVSNMGYKAQQAGYQVQDLFVQIGGGQGVLRSLSQQAPQFLSIFGPGGAIVGAGVAIAAVVSQLVLAKNATDKAAESLKTYAEYAAELKETLEGMRFDRLDPFGQQDDLGKQIIKKQHEIQKLRDTVSGLNALLVNPPNMGPIEGLVFRQMSSSRIEEAQAKIGKATNELAALQKKLKGVNEDIAKDEQKSAEAFEDATNKRVQAIKDQMKAQREAVEAANAALEKEGEAIRKSVLTPHEQLAEAKERLSFLYRQGVIDIDTFDRKVDQLTQRLLKQPEAMEKIGQGAQEWKRAMSSMFQDVSNTAGDAFADLVIKGENAFGSLVDVVARSVVRIVAQMAIINPILNGLFGGIGGFNVLPAFFGAGAAPVPIAGAKAFGGPVRSGSSYLVGEKGPEIFTPSQAGRIIPNHKMGNQGGGGNTYYIDARGADVGAVSRIEQALITLAGPGVTERRAITAIGNDQSRGGMTFA